MIDNALIWVISKWQLRPFVAVSRALVLVLLLFFAFCEVSSDANYKNILDALDPHCAKAELHNSAIFLQPAEGGLVQFNASGVAFPITADKFKIGSSVQAPALQIVQRLCHTIYGKHSQIVPAFTSTKIIFPFHDFV